VSTAIDAASRGHDDEPGREAIRAAGLRATPQRLAAYEAIQRAGGRHLSADDVWQQLRRHPAGMDRSTAYRILGDLARSGLLKEVRLADGVARFEIQDAAHHHAVCTRCGATEDVGPAAVRALSRRLRADTGFILGEQTLLLPGLCRACAAER
jgi:Fe2+ or Zn2+ uptake regulation protein